MKSFEANKRMHRRITIIRFFSLNSFCGLQREAGPPQGRLPLLGDDLLFLLTVDSRLPPLPPVVRFSNLPMNRSLGLT